ncbi:ABC transporter type 1, transmembrane domain-containing protein [Mycena metata]|uniref:ABC transporter type 1, transmembrane domain-containing protein n=1 Tax=Mycena metata TaxID=1033252 RepID=A0AAD7HMT8_9AGAR|nr:ABC transporter type 1, transmembrane domain-containing protein [Mycena metata]
MIPVSIVEIGTIALMAVFIYLIYGQLQGSKVIHTNLMESTLSGLTLPRIIARGTNDVRTIDDSLPGQFWGLCSMIIKLLVVVIYTPLFFFPAVLVGLLGAWIGQIYIPGQLPVKRLMSNTRAPVLAHFGAATAGLVSIRAYGAQSKFNAESLTKIDRYTRAARNFYNLDRWVSVHIDLLGALFLGSLAAYLVYIKRRSAGEAGFSINQAITFTSYLLMAVSMV